MLQFDITAICAAYAAANRRLTPKGMAGFSDLVTLMREDPLITDVRWMAYMLATVRHECADRWRPIEEFGKGARHTYGVPVRVSDADGTSYTNTYYGRGYVQLTWKYNYDKVGRALGMGNALVLHPEQALQPATAYDILSLGMRTGLFTGKKLADYISPTKCDYVNARRIINGLDRAELLAGYAVEFEKYLRAAKAEPVVIDAAAAG